MHSLENSARHFAKTTKTTRLGRISLAFALLLALLVTISPWALSPASAAAAADTTVLGTATPTGLAAHTDTSGVEVGTQFTASTNGKISAMRFWKGQNASGTPTGTLWNAQGKKLARATFSSESETGWQTATFDRSVAVKTGETFTVSYYAAKGRYAVTQNYTGTSVSPGLSIKAGAGVFAYGAASAFPTKSFRNSMYWVDVVFTQVTLPTAATTGPPAGTTLKASGGITITTDGAVYDGYRFSGDVAVQANNVTIRNSVINGRVTNNALGLKVERTEIVGPGGEYQTKYPAIGYDNYSCDGCDIHGWGDGAHVAANTTIKNSWIHDIAASGASHNQAILSLGGDKITITNNVLSGGSSDNFTAALSLLNQGLAFTNTLVQGNLFDGGGYCVYGGGEAKGNTARPSSNVRFLDNTFGTDLYAKCGYYGPVTAFDSSGPGNQWRNNSWEDGTPVNAAS